MGREIKWKCTGSDKNDLIAHFECYCLRVERMDKNYFWYALYYHDNEILMDSTFGIRAVNLDEAKKLVELAMWTHRVTNANLYT